jgi:transcriptional regulator with XRE-family HTH domain
MTFALRLKEILTFRNKTQSDLARHLGIRPQSVGQWGKGVKPTLPRQARLDLVAKFLDVTVPELFAPPGTPFKGSKAVAEPRTDSTPGGGDLVKGVDQKDVVHAWEKLPEEHKGVLLEVLNGLLARNGLPPIGRT